MDLYVAPTGGAPMERRREVELAAGGVVGDRYRRGTGHYSALDGCPVTLVDADALRTVRESFDVDLSGGAHRRNVVLEGVPARDLVDVRFRLGEAVLQGTRPRPPCAHLEAVTDEDDLLTALGDGRGGVCATVVEPGPVAVGDALSTPASLTQPTTTERRHEHGTELSRAALRERLAPDAPDEP